MKTQLFIPDKIKVGYQHRADTYTKKLAYVIYYDKKGILRKEASWSGWIHDKPRQIREWENGNWVEKQSEGLPVHDFENVPTEGFVLNKGIGGVRHSSGWNARNEYIRVYDPRDFEFEISVANLLFILAHCDAYRGKGLEGKFVYSWEGKELVLLPTDCQEYRESSGFTEIQGKKVSARDLVPGYSYRTKGMDELIYLGRFPIQTNQRVKEDHNWRTYRTQLKKEHVFYDEKTNSVTMPAPATLGECINDVVVSNYADLMDKFNEHHYSSVITELNLKPLEQIIDFENTSKEYWNHNPYLQGKFYLANPDGNSYTSYKIESITVIEYIGSWNYGNPRETKETFKGYHLRAVKNISFINNIVTTKDLDYGYSKDENSRLSVNTKEEILNMNFRELYVKLEDGREFKFEKYGK